MTALQGWRVNAPTLVGREAELEALAAVLSHSLSLAMVEGEAGIGKTRLVQELRARPEFAERRFLAAGCPPIQEPFPLGPVLDMVRELREELAGQQLPEVTGVLRPLLPDLSSLLPPSPAPLGDAAADRHRTFYGLRELFGSTGPTTMVIEDLHWADQQTIDLIHYLLNHPPGALSLVVTFRGEEVGPQVRGLTSGRPARLHRAHVVLRPLDPSQTGQLAAGILDTAHVSSDVASYLCERTGGLPFAIEEVLALLRERATPASPDQRLRQSLEGLGVPAGVRDHVLARAGQLPEVARSSMEPLAVLQRPATEQLVAEVATEDPEQIKLGLSHAVRSGLLVDDGEIVGFRHVLAAQAVYDGIPGPRRRMLHDRAAAALQAAAPVGGQAPELLGQVAYHLRWAGRLEEWAVAAERAADRAVTLGHHTEAVRQLEEVLRQAPLLPPAIGRLAVKLGWAATAALHGAVVTDLLAQVLESELPPSVRAELQMLLGALLDGAVLDSDRSRELFRAAAESTAVRGEIRAWAMVALAMRNPPELLRYPQRQRWVQRALEIVPTGGDRDFETFLLGKEAQTGPVDAGSVTASIPHPADAETVGPRVTGSDDGGNTVVQTMPEAYRLS